MTQEGFEHEGGGQQQHSSCACYIRCWGDFASHACNHTSSNKYSELVKEKEQRSRSASMSSSVTTHIEEGLNKVSSSTSSESNSGNGPGGLKEHDYIGLSEVSSSMESSVASSHDGDENNLNLKETELRLGLPGSLSPVRDSSELSLLTPLKIRPDAVEEKNLFPVVGAEKQQHSAKDGAVEEKSGQEKYVLSPAATRSMMIPTPKNIVSGAKRGFSEAMEPRNSFPDVRNNGFSSENQWVFPNTVGAVVVTGSDVELPKANSQGKFLPQGLVPAAATPNVKQGPASWHTGGLDHSGNCFMPSRLPAGPNLNGKTIKDGTASAVVKDIAQSKMPQERPRPLTEPQHGSNQNQMPSGNDQGMAPAAKLQCARVKF